MSKLNPVATNPVLTKDLVTLIIWFAGRYGWHLDVETATLVAGVFFTGASWFVRQLVKPTAKIQAEQQAEQEAPSDPAMVRQLVAQVLAELREQEQPPASPPAPAIAGAPVEPAG